LRRARGEFDILARLRGRIAQRAQEGVRLGPGDDAALVEVPRGRVAVLTTDMLVEEVDFSFRFGTSVDLAHKALEASLSDVAAMGAVPHHVLCALAMCRADMQRHGERFLGALVRACKARGVALVGGDLSATAQGVACVAITVVGSVEPGRAVTRGGAHPDDRVMVVGPLGLSAAGLKRLRADAQARTPRAALLAYRRPRAQVEAGRVLGEAGVASAMIDVSDGLLQDLAHVARASGVGIDVRADALPVPRAVREVADDAREAQAMVAAGGDDLALAFSVPPRALGRLRALGLDAHEIGSVREGAGVRLVDATGTYIDGMDTVLRGHDHFAPPGPV
jgi:thiamine-monophosphate kinase